MSTVKLDYQDYYSKVLGGWLGKFIGGTIGGPVEGQKEVHRFEYYSETPTIALENDENDFQLTWLHALQTRGLYLTSNDLIEEWLQHLVYPYCEYGYAVKNFRRGIMPPVSGWFNNRYFKECMGCPVRSEIWGFVCPGNPKLAAEYAWMDATLDHAEASVWAEVFLAAIDSMVFFESDIRKLLQIGLDAVPSDSQFAQCINDAIRWHDEGHGWLEARRFLLDKYGSPDFTSALQNLGITALALIYGGGDFEKTMLIAANCGYDSDCTCATAGAIVGAVLGADGIPSKWKDPLNDRFKPGGDLVGLERENRLSTLAEETCEVGIAMSLERNKQTTIVGDLPTAKRVIKAAKPVEGVALAADYKGCPTIGYEQSKTLAITVENGTDKPYTGSLTLQIPAGWEVSPGKHDVEVGAGQTRQYEFSLYVPTSVKNLPYTNLLKAVLGDAAQLTFGLAGENVWTVLGPFWRTVQESQEETDKERQMMGGFSTLPTLRTMFCNDAGIDFPYLPESEISADTKSGSGESQIFESRIISCPEDEIDLNSVFTMRGPAVLYLLQYVECPDARKAWFLIGNNDAVKVWLNGKMVLSTHEHRCMMPFNNAVAVDLKKGVNRIVVKVGRCVDDFAFSFGIRERKKNHWHQEQWMVDIASVHPMNVKQGDKS
jgi:ADP-ribosylglycohydrolase